MGLAKSLPHAGGMQACSDSTRAQSAGLPGRKSTQTFIASLDLELRFLREYEEIRPLSPHCRERKEVSVSSKDQVAEGALPS